MTLYAVHFCPCGWTSEVHEDSSPKNKTCPDCKRELCQVRGISKQSVEEVATNGKAAPKDGPSRWLVPGFNR